MSTTNQTPSFARGKVNLREKNGGIEIYFSYGGQRKTLGAGSYTPANLKAAEIKVKQIELDIISGNFDPTLDKYRSQKRLERKEKAQLQTPLSIWEPFLKQLALQTKVTTQGYNEGFISLFKKVGEVDVLKAEDVKEKLLKVTTVDQTKRALAKLSAACKWAVKKGILPSNPYQDMAGEMPRFRYQTDPKPNAFSQEEVHQILEAFRNDKRAGHSFACYAPLVEFWFLTGCRPSEGIGLQWKHVSPDFQQITFETAITQAGGKGAVRVELSKNNRKRSVTCSARLKALLEFIRPEHYKPEDLVFPSPRGGPVNYNNFCQRAWDTLVDPIKPDTTPYSCRDTFITTQILAKQPTYLIAKWCDTSIKMIEGHYADVLKMAEFAPTDYTMPSEI